MQDIGEKKRPSFHNIKKWFITGLLVSLPITSRLTLPSLKARDSRFRRVSLNLTGRIQHSLEGISPQAY